MLVLSTRPETSKSDSGIHDLVVALAHEGL